MPKHVLHIVGKMHRGGIETLVMNLYRNINRNKYQFDFLCFTKAPGYYDEEIRELGGRLFYVAPRREHPIQNQCELMRLMKSGKFFGIHQHMSSCSYINPLKTAYKADIKMRIAHAHNTSCGGMSRVLHGLNRNKISHYANGFLGCSEEALEWMFPKNIIEKKVLLNGIHLNKFKFDPIKRREIRIKYGLSDAFVIGFCGRFEEQKNPLFLAQIFSSYIKRNSNCKLLMVGDGSLRSELERYLTSEGIVDSCIFTGVVDNPEDYYQAMDCLVQPSVFEGLGIMFIEAQASGLPVIMPDTMPALASPTQLACRVEEFEIEDWLREIEKIESITIRSNREVYCEAVKSAGFDIEGCTLALEHFYDSFSGECE